jgi:mannuronan 5-epimerase
MVKDKLKGNTCSWYCQDNSCIHHRRTW